MCCQDHVTFFSSHFVDAQHLRPTTSSPSFNIITFVWVPGGSKDTAQLLAHRAKSSDCGTSRKVHCFESLQIRHRLALSSRIMDLSSEMLRNAPKTLSYHYKQGNLNWPMIVYISLVHMVAFAGLLAVPNCSKETLLWAFLLWPIR